MDFTLDKFRSLLAETEVDIEPEIIHVDSRESFIETRPVEYVFGIHRRARKQRMVVGISRGSYVRYNQARLAHDNSISPF